MIETGILDSASSSIGQIASQVSNLASSVSGYDTSCDDGFDFASAKNIIASNLEACVTKVQNTASILNAVSQSHTELQNSLKFEDPAEAAKKNSSTKSTSSQSSYSGGSSSSGGYSGGSGYSSGGGYSGGSRSGGGGGEAEEADRPPEDKKKRFRALFFYKFYKNLAYIKIF